MDVQRHRPQASFTKAIQRAIRCDPQLPGPAGAEHLDGLAGQLGLGVEAERGLTAHRPETLPRPHPQDAVGGFSQGPDFSRGGGGTGQRINHHELKAIKPRQPVASPDPQETVACLGNTENAVVRQALLTGPNPLAILEERRGRVRRDRVGGDGWLRETPQPPEHQPGAEARSQHVAGTRGMSTPRGR